MRINFRQGIVSHQAGGFLELSSTQGVNLLALNRPIVVTVAHRGTNYIHSENNTIANAWSGPFSPLLNYWLYWDFNQLTFERTFGYTTLEPVAQSVEPGAGNAQIIGVIPGGPGVGGFIVPEYYALPTGKTINVVGSPANDHAYQVVSVDYEPSSGQSTIYVTWTAGAPALDPQVGGSVTTDIDCYGQPLRQEGRHWYDTASNRHFYYHNNVWVEVLRVFAAQLHLGTSFLPQTITGGSFIGTQIGNTSSVRAGRVLFDEASNPIRRDDRTFFTSEDQFFAGASRIDAIRLESNVARAQCIDTAIAQFQPVAWVADGKIRAAQYNDVETTVVGVLTEDLISQEVGGVVIQGVITNTDWSWTHGPDAIPVGSPLWIMNGDFVAHDPHVTNASVYPIGRVPVARVLDNDTIVFEQGLGGKGDRGPPGTVADLPPATTSSLGAVIFVTPPSVPELAYAISDTDPRLTDARIPLPHVHDALDVSFTNTIEITSNNLQDALVEVEGNKVNRSGDTMTGYLTLVGDPTQNYHAATKHYVDSLVNGLVWLNPICVTNLISDVEVIPPLTPQLGDSYILPSGLMGDWSGFTPGDIVSWNGTAWFSRGQLTTLVSAHNGGRAGISIDSNTVAGGSFTGHDNEIAIFDSSGVLTGFEVPTSNNAVYVCSEDDIFAFNQYAFTGTEWIQFGGKDPILVDEVTITQNGNVISVKQFNDGGINDVKYWQGLEPSDLTSLYAPLVHSHTLASLTDVNVPTPINGDVLTYNFATLKWEASAVPVPTLALNDLTDVNTTPSAGHILTFNGVQWNSQAPSIPTASEVTSSAYISPIAGVGSITSTNVQDALEELYDEKASIRPTYPTPGDLPPAADVQGMFAYIVSTDRIVFSNGTVWVGIGKETRSIPYDIAYFIAGPMIMGSTIVGSFVVPRPITLRATLPNSVAVAKVGPSGPVSYNIVRVASGIPTTIGQVTFSTGATVGGFVFLSDVIIYAGDILEIITPAVVDSVITDVSITLVGCAQITEC